MEYGLIFVFENESWIRICIFMFGFIGFFLLGLLFPFRKAQANNQWNRWVNNSLLTFLNSALLKFALPFSVVFLATEYKDIGLLTKIEIPMISKIIIGTLFLDFAIYWQHRFFHCIPILWRLHRVHHTDTEFDVTTALRFHTLEILLSFGIKSLLVIVMGIPAISVIVFEILLNFCAMFNHGNFRLPKTIEPSIRTLIVTPSMHRIHHSVESNETNSNFGFCLSIWDRLFSSYLKNPKSDPMTMPIGIKTHRESTQAGIFQLLIQPFSK